MRFNYNTKATQKRIASYSGNKGAYATVSGVSFYGFHIPIEPSMKTETLGIIGQAYEFHTDGHKDIQANDILIIATLNYLVKGVQRQKMGRNDVLRCTLELMVNG